MAPEQDFEYFLANCYSAFKTFLALLNGLNKSAVIAV